MSSIPFQPAIFGASSAITVQLALGADLTQLRTSWTWTDVIADVMYSPGIDTVHGQADETSKGQPATCAFDLLNIANLYSYDNPTCVNYPNIVESTPVRVLRTNGAGVTSVEFFGFAIGFSPGYDETGKWTVTHVSAAGRLQRIGTGKSPFRSPAFRAMNAANVDFYWPCEEGQGAIRAAENNGGPSLQVAGSVEFGVDTSGTGVLAAIDFTNGGHVVAGVQTVAGAPWRIGYMIAPTVAIAQTARPVAWSTSDGATWTLELIPSAGAGNANLASLEYRSADLSVNFGQTLQLDLHTPALNLYDGTFHSIIVECYQNGANIGAVVYVDQVAQGHIASATGTASTLAAVKSIRGNYVNSGVEVTTYQLSHMFVDSLPVGTAYPSTIVNCLLNIGTSGAGWVGELAHVRWQRIATENNIPFTLTGTSATAMGVQGVLPLLDQLQEPITADGGIMYDGYDDGIGMICRASLYNQAATLTIDAGVNSQLDQPFEPVNDTQRLRNQFTASLTNSGFSVQPVTFSDLVTPRNINKVGIWDSSGSYNFSDATASIDLASRAAWEVGLGTVAGLRYPTLGINFISPFAAALEPAWLARPPVGFRVDVINVATSALNHPPNTVRSLAFGYAAHYDLHQHSVVMNTVSAEPWFTGVVASTLRIGSYTTGLIGANSANTTQLTMYSQDGPWITTLNANGGDFPIPVGVNGEQLSATAIASACVDSFTRTVAAGGWGNTTTPVLSWTVTGTASDFSVNGSRGLITTSATGSDRFATVGGVGNDHDIKVRVVAQAIPTTDVLRSGLTVRWSSSTDHYIGYAEVAPTSGLVTLVIAKRVAGTFTVLATVPLTASLKLTADAWLRFQIEGNGLALKFWNDGAVQEPPVWQAMVQDTSFAAGVTTGVFARRQGTAPTAVLFDDFEILNPQLITVTRAVNGVARATVNGDQVRLWRPAVIAG